MKGTLISADFISDESSNLRLLEINTDTGFISASFSNLDYTDFFNVLSSESIDTVHVIYKDFHIDFVDHLSSSISNSFLSSSITTFTRQLEEISGIYPTSVTDADNKFILRLAYDESAILDSEYAKDNINLYNLYTSNNDTGSIAEFCYSSSLYEFDNLTSDTINNQTNLPDIAVRNDRIGPKLMMNFYKIGHSVSSSADRVEAAKANLMNDDTLIQKYYVGNTSDSNVKSIRSYKIIYGTNLDMLGIGEYEVSSILEKPTACDYEDSRIVNWQDRKHYFEFTTNEIRTTTEGIIGEQEIINASGSAVAISGSQIGDVFKSYYIAGAPDTDDQAVFRAWSHSGSTLPSGSYPTSSTVTYVGEEKSRYNTVANITVGGSSFRVSPFVYLLVYDSVGDKIVYRFPYEMDTTNYKLINQTGSLENITSINLEVLEGEYDMYSLNLEDVDNFILADGGLSSNAVTHNCFAAGTEILIHNETGDTKEIQDIKVGDEIWTWNQETTGGEVGIVGEIKESEVNQIVQITFSDTIIITTPEHPFFIVDKSESDEIGSWIKAKDLKPGLSCRRSNGEENVIEDWEIKDETRTVYNLLSVSPNHNFYANDILVHNK